MPPRISLIIPVFNEQDAIQNVLGDLPADFLTEIIVVDNGSTDQTARIARQMGARVVVESRCGYGSACLAGIATADDPDILAFLDGDYSDFPEELTDVVRPILEGRADLVIGSRVLGEREPGALLPQTRFGNWLATFLIEALFGTRFTDLGRHPRCTPSDANDRHHIGLDGRNAGQGRPSAPQGDRSPNSLSPQNRCIENHGHGSGHDPCRIQDLVHHLQIRRPPPALNEQHSLSTPRSSALLVAKHVANDFCKPFGPLLADLVIVLSSCNFSDGKQEACFRRAVDADHR